MRTEYLVITILLVFVGNIEAQTALETAPVGTMAKIMRGVYFPNSNILFDVQMQDPGAPPEEAAADGTVSSTFSSIYTGWEVVENAALVLAEGASLINKPGRICQNGRMAPVQRWDWLKYSGAMTDVAWDIYLAASERNQEVVSELTNNLAEACDACHRVYRSNSQSGNMRCLGPGVIIEQQ